MGKIIIIAEAGVNHNGSIDLAKRLAKEAKECKADYIKYQTFITSKIISSKARKANYQIQNTDHNQSQYDMVKRLELSFEDFIELKKYCDEIGIGFLSTAFDIESLNFLISLNLDYYKIASGEITNKFLLEEMAKVNKPTLLSTGMSNDNEIKEAINILSKGINTDKIILMHCNTEYPTPLKDVNLKAIKSLKKIHGLKVGFSDHTLGIEISLASVLMGVSVIEKHFTLDKSYEGPDHKMSLDKTELFNLVRSIRNIEESLKGNGVKEPSKSELKNIDHIRKSLHYSVDLKSGTILEKKHLIALRPGSGISPMKYDLLLGKKLVKDVIQNDIIRKEDFKYNFN